MSRRSEFARQRRLAGFSQERLADAMKVDRSTIARWEAGEATPLATFRPQLASLLNVSAVELEEMLAQDPGTSAGDGRPSPPQLVISGSRSPGCDNDLLDETVAALSRFVAFSGVVVNHGPVGIGIEVVTYVADQFRPAGFSTSTARFGRENVVHGSDLMIVVGGASGTAIEVTIARALGIPVLPYGPSGGTAARTLESLLATDRTGSGRIGELARCTTPAEFTALIERTMHEIGTPL
ncbi:helix-turn-helix domain-containing protein [Nocardioides sp. NPDC059952]